jgi:dipeptidyl aminopeptidase/acylaminoacyl peptidase
MTPRQVAELQLMTAAAISPDGTKVAALRRVPRTLFEEESGSSWTELYLVDRETGESRPYRALQTSGKAPVRLVLYPGEGHGNRRSASRYDLCLRLIRWMEHYLQGPGGKPPAYRLDYDAARHGW